MLIARIPPSIIVIGAPVFSLCKPLRACGTATGKVCPVQCLQYSVPWYEARRGARSRRQALNQILQMCDARCLRWVVGFLCGQSRKATT